MSIVDRYGLFKLSDAIPRHGGNRRVYEAFVKEINPAAGHVGVAPGVLVCHLTCVPLLSETITIS
jgi:hypothetical protein